MQTKAEDEVYSSHADVMRPFQSLSWLTLSSDPIRFPNEQQTRRGRSVLVMIVSANKVNAIKKDVVEVMMVNVDVGR
eukprot:757923-Hanusia_phi.AAC.7